MTPRKDSLNEKLMLNLNMSWVTQRGILASFPLALTKIPLCQEQIRFSEQVIFNIKIQLLYKTVKFTLMLYTQRLDCNWGIEAGRKALIIA